MNGVQRGSSSEWSPTVSEAFEHFLATVFAPHPALRHPLFGHVRALAASDDLSADQFEFFRHILFGRIHLTIPSIIDVLRSAALSRDLELIATCFANLVDELSPDTGFVTHVDLLERAFNTIGTKIFGLPPVSLVECYARPRLPEELTYRYTVQALYSERPVVVSFAQELSSGGLQNPAGLATPGFMAELYLATREICTRNSSYLAKKEFEGAVLPYFSAHLAIGPGYELVADADGVESMHGQRAALDYLRTVAVPEMIAADEPYVLAFLNAQAALFDRALSSIKSLDAAESKRAVG